MDECEPLAEAVYQFFQRVLPGHDWQNEADIPPVPMSSDDSYYFKSGAGNGLMWGNLRRLVDITSKPDAPPVFSEYCRRNWAPDGKYVHNADEIARNILLLFNEKGPSHDWEAENDVTEHLPSTETTTAKFPLGI